MSYEHLTSTPNQQTVNASNQPDLLVSAVLHLMSHYSVNANQTDNNQACLKLASVIERHLKALSDLPELAPVVRATCQQLSEQWANLIDKNLPEPNSLKRFSWFSAGNA
jgi:uncharacterized membrane protein YccC